MERMYNRRGEIGRYGLKLKEVVKIFTSMETIRYFCDRKTEKSLYGKSASRNSNKRKIQECSLFIAYVFTMFCCILYISEYQLQVSVAQAAIED